MLSLLTLCLFPCTCSSYMSLRANIIHALQSCSPKTSSSPVKRLLLRHGKEWSAGLCNCTKPGCACVFLFTLPFRQQKNFTPLQAPSWRHEYRMIQTQSLWLLQSSQSVGTSAMLWLLRIVYVIAVEDFCIPFVLFCLFSLLLHG